MSLEGDETAVGEERLDARGLQLRLYREIGVAAVAAALEAELRDAAPVVMIGRHTAAMVPCEEKVA